MMIKVKAILRTLINSFIPQDKYFPKILHIRIMYSFKYYISILSILTLLLVVSLMSKYPISSISQYKESIIQNVAAFPQDIELKIHKGELSTNSNAPLFLWVKHKNKPLFVFMANAREMSPRFQNPIPFIFLKKDGLQVSFRQFHQLWTYDPTANHIISRQQIPYFISQINSFFPYVVFLYCISMFILFPLAFMSFVTGAIILSSALTYLIFRTYFLRIHYKKCLQAGMHGTHIPLLFTAVLLYLFPFSTRCMPIVLALFFVFTLVSTFEMYSKEEPHHRRGR